MSEKVDLIKKDLDRINVMQNIKGNPMVNATLISMIKAIPFVGEMLDLSIDKRLEEFKNEKEQELLDVILKNKNTITSDMVNDVEFIINYAKVMEAIQRLATNDKIKYFGNLIRNGYLSGEHIESDEFEEYLDILNSMSYKEIEYLVGYKLYCDNKGKVNQKGMDKWQGFLGEYCKEKDMAEMERIIYMLPKLIRTGLVEPVYETTEAELNTEKRIVTVERTQVDIKYYRFTLSFERFFRMVLASEN